MGMMPDFKFVNFTLDYSNLSTEQDVFSINKLQTILYQSVMYIINWQFHIFIIKKNL